MRTMLKVRIPVEAGNRGVKDGIIPRVIEKTVALIKPEAVYFTTDQGRRSGFMVFDLKDQTDIPRIAEPFFLELNAEVDFTPVMSAEDLKVGLSKVGK